MRKYRAYASYKDTNSPWFPVIPDNWEILSNRYIFDLKKSQVGKNANKFTLLSLTLNGVIERDMVNPSGKFPAEFDTYQEVKKGDFIFCLFDVEETPRTVGLSNFDGMITGAYTVFNNRLAQNADYLYYFFLSLDDNKQLKPLYKGLRNTITKENFYSFKTPIPPISEQTAIANFLDKKTGEIKEFIRLKEKTIELLKERKTAIINQVVTKGLDPNVEMKNSGIEWLGEIPKHWEVKRNWCLFTERVLINKKKESLPLLSVSLNTGIQYYVDDENNINRKADDESTYQICRENDVVYNKMRMWQGAVGVSFTDGLVSPAYQVLVPKQQVSSDYYIKLFKTDGYKMEINRNSYGIASDRNRLYWDRFKDVLVPLPPIEEQNRILKFIEVKSREIDQSISQAQQEITLIKEYQQSLISEAVTGKIDVRDRELL